MAVVLSVTTVLVDITSKMQTTKTIKSNYGNNSNGAGQHVQNTNRLMNLSFLPNWPHVI